MAERDAGSGREETEEERLDRNLNELLQELRVAIPGVQVLFAFLLVVPFQTGFEKITPFQERVYFTALLLTAICAALLISPTAYHRATFRQQQKHELVFVANRLALAGLAFLALAMTATILLITDIVFGATETVVVTTTFAFLLYLTFWGLLPLRRRISAERKE
jgi:hypothetical protein